VSADEPAQEIPCPPCRATGSVISNLGGAQQQVECPWCEGTGRLSPGHDAQARWREQPSD
jgi:DnaJ-class molecular chaperone